MNREKLKNLIVHLEYKQGLISSWRYKHENLITMYFHIEWRILTTLLNI